MKGPLSTRSDVCRPTPAGEAFFRELLARFGDLLLSILRVHRVPVMDEEDARQTLTASLWLRSDVLLSDPEHVDEAIVRAAASLARSCRRRRAVEGERFEELPDLSDPRDFEAWIAERIAVQAAIDALEPRMRRVYIDHELRGYTMEEIAAAMGASIAVVKKLLAKARSRIDAARRDRHDDAAMLLPLFLPFDRALHEALLVAKGDIPPRGDTPAPARAGAPVAPPRTPLFFGAHLGAFVLVFVLGPPNATPSVAVPLVRSFVPVVMRVGSVEAAPRSDAVDTDPRALPEQPAPLAIVPRPSAKRAASASAAHVDPTAAAQSAIEGMPTQRLMRNVPPVQR